MKIREEIKKLEAELETIQQKCIHLVCNTTFTKSHKPGKLSKYLECLVCGHIEQEDVECPHPDVEKTLRSTIGNYDPSDKHYWYEFECTLCGYFWTEGQ